MYNPRVGISGCLPGEEVRYDGREESNMEIPGRREK